MKKQQTGYLLGGVTLGACGAILLSSMFTQPETAVATSTSVASVQPDDGMEGMVDPQAMMDQWMATITPGPKHEWLDHFVGTWDTTTRVWWGGPGTPANTTTGTSEVKWVLGGRFLLEESDSFFPMPGENGEMIDAPMQGIGMAGHDNVRNMFVQTWADNFTTTIHKMWGSSHDGKVFTYYGKMDEPMLNVYGRMIKSRVTIKNENEHVFEMFDLHAGDEYKVFEIAYKRQN